ncbi:hypothetical protein E3Q17_01068 [Wallemia mellicola]|uniref:EF-hand domain-containing protein n=1 Tax=Wallemia mellicola TaxID=1708541 RepID=A0A4T0PTE9_9BASI|nr:hypothetical protein E3Q17_01068 [Wallemia mellicola]TIC13964.1 hypothetical protein E3Q14_01044 [Wallemia mellicola]
MKSGAPNYPPAGGAYGASGYGSAPPHRGSYGNSYGGAAPPPPARGSYGSGASYGGTPGYGSPAGSYGAPGYAGGTTAGNTYANAGYSRPRPPTTYIDPTIRNWFETVDRNKSGQIDAQELQMALVNGDYSCLLEFVGDAYKRVMVSNKIQVDVDKTGTISIEEFAGVFKYINDWRNVFQHFDADRSGSIEGHELANALAQFGYRWAALP